MKIIPTKKILVTAGTSVLVLFAVLAVLLTATVHTTVVRDNYGAETPELERAVAELESHYLTLRGEVTLEQAAEAQLVQNDDVLYVERRPGMTFVTGARN